MNIVLGIWRLARGVWLMFFLATIFSGVLLVSCLARLVYGDGRNEVAGRLRLNS